MTKQTKRYFLTTLLSAAGLLVLAAQPLPAQERVREAITVLTRGPVHEALAEQFDRTLTPGLLITEQPPGRLRELPPEHQPEGKGIVWIPGYWAWDDEVGDFLWVSGFWRTAPPNHRWVPGAWVRDESGHRWVSGFWSPLEQDRFSYLPMPPSEVGEGLLPVGRPPSRRHFWLPGRWLYSDGGYQWRAGNWARGHDDWIWIPDRYIWSPAGAIYREGYWDHRLADRGILFAPVRFTQPIYTNRDFQYTPSHALNLAHLPTQLFVRPGYSHYYFGDYYDPVYRDRGIYPWVRFQPEYGRYDPLYTYYWSRAEEEGNFLSLVGQWYDYYRVNEALRPPGTLADQRLFANRYADSPRLLANALLATGLQELVGEPGRWQFRTLSQPARLAAVEATQPLIDLAQRRSEVTPEAGQQLLQLPELPAERVEVLKPVLEDTQPGEEKAPTPEEQMPAEEREQEKPEPETPGEGPAAEEDEAAPEQPGSEQPQPEEPAPEQPAPEQPAPKQPAPEQPAPEQPAPEQPAPEELVPTQSATE
jgi:hypothetical protein